MSYDGPWEEPVRRSGLALKLLHFADTGAIAAAATTSLPERLGGNKNWDYRYMWVRDCFVHRRCLHQARLARRGPRRDQLAAALRALHDARNQCLLHNSTATSPNRERHLDAPGYRNSEPVRAGQRREHADPARAPSVTCSTRSGNTSNAGHLLDPPTGRLLADLADRCCDRWQTKDSGIWELTTRRHYTISKMGCWVALDRAVTLHAHGHIPTAHAHRWARERDTIKAWINAHCWSGPSRLTPSTPAPMTSTPQRCWPGSTGFDRGERLAGTVAAIQRELMHGPLVYRYTGAETEEGAFVACTFWMVTALAALGRTTEGCELMDQAVHLTNDVGLLSEQIDVATGAMLGNFPQGLSHLALVNAAFALQDTNPHAL